MMSPNFEYYKVFYYVSKYQNFTMAAKLLLTSQPSVTRSIKSLEYNLGCQLFVRSARGVVLTPEGELLYKHIAAAYESIIEGEEALANALNLQDGSVNIGATETAIHCFLLDKLEQFHNMFPHVVIKIINNSTPSVIADLKSGKIDLAVVTTPVEKESNLIFAKVKSFKDILVGGSNFSDLENQELALADLEKYPLICMSKETMTNKFYSDFYARHGIQMRPDIELATADLLLPIIKKNLGIGFIPDILAEEALGRGDVIHLKLIEEIPDRYICVAQDTRYPLSVAAHQLLKLLRSDEQELPDAQSVE